MATAELPLRLPATLLADAPELRDPATLSTLLEEWACSLEPRLGLEEARGPWFDVSPSHRWVEAAQVRVDRELVESLRNAADDETRQIVRRMLERDAEQILEPTPPEEAALPILLGLAALAAITIGVGAKAAELRDGFAERRVWTGRRA